MNEVPWAGWTNEWTTGVARISPPAPLARALRLSFDVSGRCRVHGRRTGSPALGKMDELEEHDICVATSKPEPSLPDAHCAIPRAVYTAGDRWCENAGCEACVHWE